MYSRVLHNICIVVVMNIKSLWKAISSIDVAAAGEKMMKQPHWYGDLLSRADVYGRFFAVATAIWSQLLLALCLMSLAMLPIAFVKECQSVTQDYADLYTRALIMYTDEPKMKSKLKVLHMLESPCSIIWWEIVILLELVVWKTHLFIIFCRVSCES